MPPASAAARAKGPDFIDAKASLALLGVRLQTLYSYVSRGAIRSLPQPGTKAHLYSRMDVERVAARAAARAGHGAVAAGAMFHGAPIVDSGITEITDRGPRYRGHLAVDLVEERSSFEAVCALLWDNRLPGTSLPPWKSSQVALAELDDLHAAHLPGTSRRDVIEVIGILALHMARNDARRMEEGRGSEKEDVRLLIRSTIAAIGVACGALTPADRLPSVSVAGMLAVALGRKPEPALVAALDAVLVLLADHELPPGTLAVRAAASGASNLFACIGAGTCASAGPEIGRHYDLVNAFLGDRPVLASMRDKALRLHRQGKRTPGFNHPLYPDGDPRAVLMMEMAAQGESASFPMREVLRFISWAEEEYGALPRHEFALVCLLRALGLPGWVAGPIFVLARMAGWAAHVHEQRSALGIWRPRARYVVGGATAEHLCAG